MIACASSRAMVVAAQAIAAEVLRPIGSPKICDAGTDGKCSCTRSAMLRPVTTHACSGATTGSIRASDSCIMLRPLGSGKNCLGKAGVLSGQRRVPLPPAKITALRCSSISISLKPHCHCIFMYVVHFYDRRIVKGFVLCVNQQD